MTVKKTHLAAVFFILAFLAVLVYSTLGIGRYRCEVCITYMGRTACRTAAASDKEQALRTATENACALIASGVTESIQCGNTRPDSVRWLD